MATATFTNSGHTTLITGKKVRRRYQTLKKELRQIIQKLHTDQLVLNYGPKVAAATPADLIRVISEWPQKDVLDLTIRNIMVDAILASENKQIGAGIICACSLLQTHRDDTSGAPRKGRAVRDNLSQTLKYFLGRGIIYNLCETLLEMGGMSSSIRFDLGSCNDFVVRQIDTHELFGVVHPLFGSHPASIDSPTILAVDGIIESVGEIDYLLQRAAETKCSVILCAMGFDPHVVNTLSHNWKANRLRVFPFWIRNLEPDQKLLRLCEEMKITCITPERGDLINTQDLDECTTAEAVFLSDQSLAIQNESGDGQHLEVYIPRRFKSLSGLIEDRCRVALRACVSIASTGTADISILHKIIEELDIPLPPISSASLEIGMRAASTCKKIINDLGGIIVPQ